MEIRDIDKNIGTPILVMFKNGKPRPSAIRIIERKRSTVYAQYNIHGQAHIGVWHRDHLTMVTGNHSTAELRTILDAIWPTYVETRAEHMPHAKCPDTDCGQAKHNHYPAWIGDWNASISR
mgnify:CR=1 FL=1